jgi:hypothetical protein
MNILSYICAASIVVSMRGCQPRDPGRLTNSEAVGNSIPGRRIQSFFKNRILSKIFYELINYFKAKYLRGS